MTIITAKLPGKALCLTPLALAALLVSAECRAEWKFSPSIGVSETYSDNPGLQRDEDAHGQWISEAIPGFTLTTHSRRLRLSATGEWHYYAYQQKNIPNLHDREGRYGANAEANLIEDFLLLDASASGSRQAISAFGPRFTEPYSTFNRTDVKTWSISPVLQHRFGSAAEVQLRVTRDSVTTDGDAAAAAFADSRSTTGLFSVTSPDPNSAFGWGLQYMRQNLETDRFGGSTSVNASANVRYRLSRTWSAVASAGHDSYDFTTLNSGNSGPSYTAGFVWTPSSRTTVDARLGHSFLGKTGSLSATQRSRRLISRVTYTDQVTTSRAQFLLPAAIDTAAMLDQLFSSTISDPILRAQAVQSYMTSTGLPPSLANNVNYLSNRYMREKRLQAAFIYTLAHSTISLSAYKSERTALSLDQTDSELLGSQFATLNDNVRQRGVDASVSYRLSPRTAANATASATRSTSITTGIMTPSHYVSLGLTRQFDRKARATVELRHIHSANGALTTTAGSGPGSYTENALSATLSVQF
jgi:uncharacterized protein (PEP-CTERM system associated)